MISVKEIREKMGVSQNLFASITNIPRDRISKWEQGKSSPKALDFLTIQMLYEEWEKNPKEFENKYINNDKGNNGDLPIVSELGVDYITERRRLKNVKPIEKEKKINQGIPIYDIPIDASFLERYRDNVNVFEPVGFLNIPKLRNCNFAAMISGNSMYPIMKSGTIAACRIIENFDYFDEGEMYFISTTNGFETVKYIQTGENVDELKLIPHNDKIKSTTIKKSMIIRMCIVEAWLNFR